MLGIGCSALRGDLSLGRAGPAKDEVFEVFEEKDEHQAQQGPYSFPCTSTHSLENYPRVGFLGLNEGTFFLFWMGKLQELGYLEVSGLMIKFFVKNSLHWFELGTWIGDEFMCVWCALELYPVGQAVCGNSHLCLLCCRRMIPHKTKRGAAALERLKAFEGIPAPYDKIKRMVIPDALKWVPDEPFLG